MADNKSERRSDKIYKGIVTFVSSREFFMLILVILFLEALWYAFSFQPSINDEQKHLGGIHFYAQSILPFVDHQAKQWDVFGSLTRSGSYMYYYLLSWPFRLVSWLTGSVIVQVVVLRLINTAFVIAALVYFRKSLRLVGGLPDTAINMVFLFLVLTPAFALLAGMVNYDNLSLLLFAYLLFVSLRILKSTAINLRDIALFIIVGMIMVVVKWTSLCLLMPMSVFIAVDLYKTHRNYTYKKIIEGVRALPKRQLVILLGCIAIAFALFIERPVGNYLHYHKVDPSCDQVLGNQRCLSYPDYAIYQTVLRNKPASFQPADPVHYAVDTWAPKMITSATNLIESPSTQIPAAIMLYSTLAILGGVLFLVYIRDILRQNTKFRIYLLVIVLAYVLFLMAGEYSAYRQYGIPAAIRTRYLIPVLPVGGYFLALSVMMLFGRFKKSLAVMTFVVLLFMTQGGGITTYIITTPTGLYWPNGTERNINRQLREIFLPVVKE